TVGTRERYRLREGNRLARLGVVLPVPLLLVRVAQGAWVAARVIARLRILPLLRREGQRTARDLEDPLRSLDAVQLRRRGPQIRPHIDREIAVVEDGRVHVRHVAAILPAADAADGRRLPRRRVAAAHE